MARSIALCCATEYENPVVKYERLQLERTLSEAEGYMELGMPEFAVAGLQRRGKLVHASARGCYLMGEALRDLGRYREAIYPLRRSVDLMPDDVRAWLALGWCYKRTGHLERAIEALEQALDFDPAEAVLHYNLACYWSLAHNRGRALDYLARALDMDSNFRDLVNEESDFDPLRSDPGFKMLTSVVV